jgi:hypothetical protein
MVVEQVEQVEQQLRRLLEEQANAVEQAVEVQS